MKYKIVCLFFILLTPFLCAIESSENRWVKDRHIVKDRALNLIWQDTKSVKIRKKTWSGAKKYCERLTLAGKSNWRLPTLHELLTTVDYTRSSPALLEHFSFSDKRGYYWSSSAVSTDERYAWYISIDKGNTYAYSKEETAFMRCVCDDK